ncbi:MAG: trehalase family glycosidase [Saprospiraceae bacterium]
MNETLLSQAKAVLAANQNAHFTKPAPSLYPHQWNWDAGFIAIGYAHYDFDRAMQEMRYLFNAQWSNGLLPQIIFGNDPNARYFPGPDFWWTERSPAAPKQVKTSGITMPPVHGFVLKRMYEIAENKQVALAFLKEMYPKVVALHRYLYTHRDPQQEGLVCIRHPWESGTDNSPLWDNALQKMDLTKVELPAYERKDLQNPQAREHRPTDDDYDRYVYLVDLFRQRNYDDQEINMSCPFQIQCPLFNSVLAWSNECLIEIGQLIGEDITEVREWYELTTYSMNEKLWDEERGMYDAYDVWNEEKITCHTSSGLMPLIAGIPSYEQSEVIEKTYLLSGFRGDGKTPVWLFPTYNLTERDVNYTKYWRGPIWMNMNWLLVQGLRRYNISNPAKQLRQHSLHLIEKYGFYEYFDPRQSVAENGYGTNQFSWSAALTIDFLLEER